MGGDQRAGNRTVAWWHLENSPWQTERVEGTPAAPSCEHRQHHVGFWRRSAFSRKLCVCISQAETNFASGRCTWHRCHAILWWTNTGLGHNDAARCFKIVLFVYLCLCFIHNRTKYNVELDFYTRYIARNPREMSLTKVCVENTVH